MAASPTPAQPTVLSAWDKLFYDGDRLRAEVSLHGAAFAGHLQPSERIAGCALILGSYGVATVQQPLSPFVGFQSCQPEPSTPKEAWQQMLSVADLPDALLFWALFRKLPSLAKSEPAQRMALLQRLVLLICQQWPGRPDLLYQVLMHEGTGSLSYAGLKQLLKPSQCYSRTDAYLVQFQMAWAKNRFEAMWLGCLRSQIDGRHFPLTDHHIRGLSVLGEAERTLYLFEQLYKNNPSQFQRESISNMLFIALGREHLPHALVSTLSSHFNRLAAKAFDSLPLQAPAVSVAPKPLEVQEKPLLVVVSSDLRQHPVGRFWLPIARHLRSKFQVISVAGHPRDQDPIRAELLQLSDEWWPLEPAEIVGTAVRIREHQPSLLLDLGGHSADNHPQILTQRLAKVQATYLGFYGPTYASCCDWWIVDRALMGWIEASYPGAEQLWPLPGPSLCYVPELHGLPDTQFITYKEPNHPVYGSFNHTRKITRASQERFGAVLSFNPDAVLQFRSYSFSDSAVRRHFLQRFRDVGIAAHQLQPLPYAPSYGEATADFGRIHLHLDSYPVSGTTTTLDSLAMGIPVLTSPTPYYAGAISSAILQHAGLADHICSDPGELPGHARWLAERYRSAAARRALAKHVRQSPICDDQFMPRMFVDQLEEMLRQKMSA